MKSRTKAGKVPAQYLLPPALVAKVKIQAAREAVRPNRLVERILTEGLKRPDPEPATA